jgi:pSer/pThr/pTyr-binding forkhead associated (FHA) protein
LKCDTALDQKSVSPHTIHASAVMREMIDALLQETVLILTPQSITFRVGEQFLSSPIDRKIFIGSDSAMTMPAFLDLSHHLHMHFGISRLHAVIVRFDDFHYQVMDLDSTNGSSINDMPLEPFQLYHIEDDTTLQIGKCPIHVLYEAE